MAGGGDCAVARMAYMPQHGCARKIGTGIFCLGFRPPMMTNEIMRRVRLRSVYCVTTENDEMCQYPSVAELACNLA
jgi:hypothetical protein